MYAVLAIGWLITSLRTQTDAKQDTENLFIITVVVAARNEEDNLPALLESLIRQDFDGKLEIIVSDDGSEDHTVKVAQDFIPRFAEKGWGLVVLDNRSGAATGKKHALNTAIKEASGEIILTTDADCVVPDSWVSLMAAPFTDPEIKMAAGFVMLDGKNSVLQMFQTIEQAILSFISFASVRSGLPFMSNGANLAFRKQTFEEVGGYEYGTEHPGGDDTFLMLAVNKRYPGSIRYMNDRNCAVISMPVSEAAEYIQQRKRHGSKVALYSEIYIRIAGLVIVITGLLHFISYLSILIFPDQSEPVIAFLTVKLFLDVLIGTIAVRKFSGSRPYAFVVPFALVYPIYLIIVTSLMLLKPGFEWKGRSYSQK